ncbi:MAG: ABC transporter substrate-binding protein [Thermomicrobiales bacterium]|nr:ABC transporter substrate-binding protein [Thermomicrobiales bacterium]
MVYLERVEQGTAWSIAETNRLVGSLTRRRLITAATAAALLRNLPAGAQSPEASPAGTRMVETDKGPVSVPARAERVVCADFYGAFAVVDLGLTPIGAGGSGFDFTGEPYSTLLADVPSTGDFQEPDLEAILALDPDLILRTIDTEDDLYARLSAIASTVVLSFQGMSLQDVAVRVGDAMGRENEANALLQEYNDACATIASTHAGVLAENTFAYVASASDSTFWFMGPPWTDTTVLLDCGVRLSEPSASQTEQVAEPQPGTSWCFWRIRMSFSSMPMQTG